MAATKQDIQFWFEQGVRKASSHMLVVCDTFDHEDYPVYARTYDYDLPRRMVHRH